MRNFNHVGTAQEKGLDMSMLSRLVVKLSDKTSVLIIVLFSLLCFIPGIFSISPIDREESRFVLTSQKMMENENFLGIQVAGLEERGLKLGTHWIQVISAKLIGSGPSSPIWIYRIPSVFGALILILALYWCVRAFADPPVALLASFLTITTILVSIVARVSISDTLLYSFMVIAHGALARIWLGQNKQKIVWYVFLFWVAFSACMLTDGPFGPMVVLLSILGISIATKNIGWIGRLKPIMGLLFSMIVTIPWIVLANMDMDGGFVISSVIKDIFGYLGHGLEDEGALPLSHFLMMQLTFWPLSAFFIIAIPTIFRNRKVPEILFFLAWAITTWVVLELMVLKIPNLMLSILPAVATITAISLNSWEHEWQIGRRIGFTLMIFVPIVFVALAIGAPVFFDDEVSFFGILACSSGLIFALVSAYQILRKSRVVSAIIPALVAAVFINIGFFGSVFPSLDSLKFNQIVGEKINEVSTCSNPDVGIVNYNEPSVDFYVGKYINFKSLELVVTWLDHTECRVAIVKTDQLPRFEELVRNIHNKPVNKATISGINFSRFDYEEFHIFQKERINSTLVY